MTIRMSKNYYTVNPLFRTSDGTRLAEVEARATRADIKLHYPREYAQMRARNTRTQADALASFLRTHGYEVTVNETCDVSF